MYRADKNEWKWVIERGKRASVRLNCRFGWSFFFFFLFSFFFFLFTLNLITQRLLDYPQVPRQEWLRSPKLKPNTKMQKWVFFFGGVEPQLTVPKMVHGVFCYISNNIKPQLHVEKKIKRVTRELAYSSVEYIDNWFRFIKRKSFLPTGSSPFPQHRPCFSITLVLT